MIPYRVPQWVVILELNLVAKLWANKGKLIYYAWWNMQCVSLPLLSTFKSKCTLIPPKYFCAAFSTLKPFQWLGRNVSFWIFYLSCF